MVKKKEKLGKRDKPKESLRSYAVKRNFKQTPEPPPKSARSSQKKPKKPHPFVIHKHAASRLHYDLRLECEGVLRSWAIPKGPSLDPYQRRLSVRVEDHPLSYRDFEGVIPKGNYGAGTMMIWDEGSYSLYEELPGESHDETFNRQYRKGNLKIEFFGSKLRGRFALIELKDSAGKDWLLLKKRDTFADNKDVLAHNLSSRSGLSMEEIATKHSLRKSKSKDNPKERENKRLLAPVILRLLKGMSKQKCPDKIQPMRAKKVFSTEDQDLPSLWHGVPPGMIVFGQIQNGEAKIKTLTGLNLSSQCVDICEALESYPDQTVFAGVINLAKKPVVFYAMDLLWLDGYPVADLALERRWDILTALKLEKPLAILDSEKKSSSKSTKYPHLWKRSLAAPYVFGASGSEWLEISSQQKRPRTSENSIPSARVQLTNASKIFWPQEGYTKKDVFEYYQMVSLVLLPHLKDRPESLHRHPNGIGGKGFFQKEVAGTVPGWVQTTNVAAYGGEKTVTYMLCQDIDTLLLMANMGCIEINPWLSRVPHILQPDFAVIDIDPGSLSFSEVVKGALIVREYLEDIGAHAFCKTSGGKGLHIYLPTNGKAEFSDCQLFAEKVGEHLQKKLPHLVSTDRNPGARRNRLYIDALQNRKGQTMASVYSLRPRPGAPVSMPILWKELGAKLNPLSLNIKTAIGRIDKMGDLWTQIFSHKFQNDIKRCLKKMN